MNRVHDMEDVQWNLLDLLGQRRECDCAILHAADGAMAAAVAEGRVPEPVFKDPHPPLVEFEVSVGPPGFLRGVP